MKNRTSLLITELLIMILVFALAGALCLRAFVQTQTEAQARAQQDGALLLAQNVAQSLKSNAAERPRAVGQTETSFYDTQWLPCDPPGAYRLEVSRLPTDYALLGAAQLQVFAASGDLLAQLEVNWQEVDRHG